MNSHKGTARFMGIETVLDVVLDNDRVLPTKGLPALWALRLNLGDLIDRGYRVPQLDSPLYGH